MDIKRDDQGFYVGTADSKDAMITFEDKGNQTIDIDHTEVSEKLRGTGMAGKLVKAVVEYAREKRP
ncbi:GNAT family N-acetyltransferase [Piscibacillus salipiscarius]|uniref:GNAT family N-acetyltransferase n=1 Tax=Piscibacillus salipiscarius TaxID=299480 RepID=UPI003F7143FA